MGLGTSPEIMMRFFLGPPPGPGWAPRRAAPGSRGVQGVLVQLVRAGQFHHVAQVHHRNAVGDVLDDVQVVGDEQVGQAQALLQVRQQVDDLGLDGHVQGRDGLVADDKLRLDGQGPGNADALALAAGKLVGKRLACSRFRPTISSSSNTRSLRRLSSYILWMTMPSSMMEETVIRGVQRGVGVLEDDLGHFGVVEAVIGVLQVHRLALVRELAVGGG